jgi:hypothetical protein
MDQFPLREALLQELKSYSGSDHPSEMYRHIFSCMEAESLELLLRDLKSQVNDENWFYSFHKSMRQTDFFNEIYVHYTTNVQTESDLKRLDELRQILPFYTEKGVIWKDVIDSEEAKSLGLEKEVKEFRFLKGKAKKEERRIISGHLDMLLWNLIHMDSTDFIRKFIERFFKLQAIEPINK